jgi:hypothetical protein
MNCASILERIATYRRAQGCIAVAHQIPELTSRDALGICNTHRGNNLRELLMDVERNSRGLD